MRGEREEVRDLVDFSPESILKSFLCLPQSLLRMEEIEMGQYTHHLGKPMNLRTQR